MKTVENIKELILGVDDHTCVEVSALKLRYVLERLHNAEASNEILRQAQRNQAMCSAEMQRENQELRMQYIADIGQEQHNNEKHERDVKIRRHSLHRFNNSGVGE